MSLENHMTNKDQAYVKELSDLWSDTKLPKPQKDAIGKAYLKNIIGLNDHEIIGFIQGDSKIDHRVGLYHGVLRTIEPNYPAFWKEVNNATNMHTKNQHDWLEKHVHYTGILAFMAYIDPILSEDSQIIKAIRTNMQAYK